MDLRDRLSLLDSKGLLVRTKYDSVEHFVEALKAYDGKKAVIDEEHRLIGNVLPNRKLLYELLGDNPWKLLSEALREPKKIPDARSMASYGYISVKPEELNVPQFFPRDAGRYLTASIVIARDPDGNLNASFHRILRKPPRCLMRIVPRHLYDIVQKRLSRGEERFEAVVAIGVHPLVALTAASSPAYGIYELEIAQSLAERLGLELKLVDAWGFPAPLAEVLMHVEIETRPSDPEGPFLDILRLYDKVRPGYGVRIREVYVRPGYLLHALLPGGEEHRILMGFPREVSIYEAVSRVVPVRSVYLTPGGGSWLHAVISIKKRREGDGKNAILAAFAGHPSLKHVVVVDEDIDVYSYEQVERAIATRFRADRDLVIIPNASGSTLDPSADGTTAKLGIDATIKGQKEKFIGEWR